MYISISRHRILCKQNWNHVHITAKLISNPPHFCHVGHCTINVIASKWCQMKPNDAKWWIIQWIRHGRLVQLVPGKPTQEIQVPQAMPLYPRYGYNSLIPIHSSRVPSYPAAETGLNWDWCRWCIANPLLYPLQCTAWSKALLDDLDGEEWQVMQSAQGAYCKWVSSQNMALDFLECIANSTYGDSKRCTLRPILRC